jgi:hypothetical protein
MPPTPITQSWVSLWQYRYTASAMGQQGRELLSHGVAAIIDDCRITYFIYGISLSRRKLWN